MTEPRVYVASLSDYNAGRLHGVWIDATQSAADIEIEVNDMLGDSPEVTLGYIPEEWAIHDYEGFGSLKLSEWETFERVSTIATLIEEHGEAFIAYCDNEGMDVDDDAEAAFEEAFCGEWSSEAEYAQELAEDIGAVPRELDWPYTCIDWQRAWNELRMGGDNYSVSNGSGGYYIFRSI